MALSLRTPTVVCKEVIGTTFSFYSPEQVRATRRRSALWQGSSHRPAPRQ
jgi:hypothetical protein